MWKTNNTVMFGKYEADFLYVVLKQTKAGPPSSETKMF